MPSPFPGMDPYLESHWLDVHGSLVIESRRLLNRTLPADLVARAEERVAVDANLDGTELETRVGPDVRVIDPQPWSGGATATMEVDGPFRLMPTEDPSVERFLRVLDDTGQVITVVEFVSPANKRRPGLTRFRRNRRDLIRAGVHFVEIDLVRSGNWRALMRPQRCPQAAVAMYRAVVRTGRTGAGLLYPMPLRHPLPDVPVPLRPGDPKVVLPVQALLAAVYDDGRYDRTLDYGLPLGRLLPPDDADWAATLTGGTARR